MTGAGVSLWGRPGHAGHAFVRVHAGERQPRLERLANGSLPCCSRLRLLVPAKLLLIRANGFRTVLLSKSFARAAESARVV